jgi:cytochrome b
MMQRIRIWDLPTRLFHGLLLLCVVGSVVTGKTGGTWMVWHFRLGYCIVALLAFRIVWGFVGGHWSRFASFIYAPSSLVAYLKGQGKPEHSAGHNPLGAGSVFALLLVLIAQVVSGLTSDDEISNAGPLAKYVSSAKVSLANWWHKDIGEPAIYALVALHVLAILFYLYKKKENLIRPMVDGDKTMDLAAGAHVPAAKDGAAQRLLAAVIFALCCGLAWWISRLG